MESLDHAICLRVVCSGSGLSGAEEGHEVGPELGFKLPSTICDDGRGNPNT